MDVEKAIFHEAMGHYGVRVLFGKEWVGCKANQLYMAMGGTKGVKDFARKNSINMDIFGTVEGVSGQWTIHRGTYTAFFRAGVYIGTAYFCGFWRRRSESPG